MLSLILIVEDQRLSLAPRKSLRVIEPTRKGLSDYDIIEGKDALLKNNTPQSVIKKPVLNPFAKPFVPIAKPGPGTTPTVLPTNVAHYPSMNGSSSQPPPITFPVPVQSFSQHSPTQSISSMPLSRPQPSQVSSSPLKTFPPATPLPVLPTTIKKWPISFQPPPISKPAPPPSQPDVIPFIHDIINEWISICMTETAAQAIKETASQSTSTFNAILDIIDEMSIQMIETWAREQYALERDIIYFRESIHELFDLILSNVINDIVVDSMHDATQTVLFYQRFVVDRWRFRVRLRLLKAAKLKKESMSAFQSMKSSAFLPHTISEPSVFTLPEYLDDPVDFDTCKNVIVF